jgi:outer membrane protein assembly factor BamB
MQVLMKSFLIAALAFVGFALIGNTLLAENWPGWRGPRGDGTSHETQLPNRWNSNENITWKIEIPGLGHASPIVWEDRVFVVSCLPETQERVLICLDRQQGKILWQKTVLTAPLEKKHNLNSHASSTPLTDGELVYVTFLDVSDDKDAKPNSQKQGRMMVAAYDFDGKQVWRREAGAFSSVHGFCSCPIFYQDLLIINGDHDGDSYIVAFEKQTGEEVWRVAREHKTRSYVTPIIRQFEDGRTQMILSGSKSVTSYDPKDGALLWQMQGPTEQFVASLVDNGKLVFLTAGFPEHHILAIDPNGAGDVTQTHIVWRTTKNCSYVPSPIVVGDYFLVASDEGIASCYLAESGERLWTSRLGNHYSASLVAAEGLVYFLADDGTCKVIRPGPELDVVAENSLDEFCFASPAISDGQIFIRGEKHLFCIGKQVSR